MEHRDSIFKGQEAGGGNVSLKCDRFKTARQGWRLIMGELRLAVTDSFFSCFVTADLTENTQRQCEIYFLPLATCTAATAVTAMFCHSPDATPLLSTSVFIVT